MAVFYYLNKNSTWKQKIKKKNEQLLRLSDLRKMKHFRAFCQTLMPLLTQTTEIIFNKQSLFLSVDGKNPRQE